MCVGNLWWAPLSYVWPVAANDESISCTHYLWRKLMSIFASCFSGLVYAWSFWDCGVLHMYFHISEAPLLNLSAWPWPTCIYALRVLIFISSPASMATKISNKGKCMDAVDSKIEKQHWTMFNKKLIDPAKISLLLYFVICKSVLVCLMD